MSQEVEYPERPISEQLVDLHVYVVPTDLWRDHLNSAINTIINETVSAGFVRVHPESSVYTLREELEGQLGYDIIPREYVFLKSVGRCLTRIRPKQEFQLKIKNFLPPLAYVPEVYLLEASPEYLSSYPSSGAPSGRNSRLDTGPSEFNPHKPMPPIRHSNAGSLQNGNDSLYSTAGTQTGYSKRSASPLTYNDSLAYTNPKKGGPGSLQSSGDAKIAGSTEAWGDARRRGPGSNALGFNPLTPVAGSEPPGIQTARNTPSDYSKGKGIHKTSQPPPPVGFQITPPSANENKDQHHVQQGAPATWAERTRSPNRSIEVQTDYVHADIVMKTYRSDGTEAVLSQPNTSRNPTRDPIHDPHSHNNLSHNSSRNPSYDPILQRPSSRHNPQAPRNQQNYSFAPTHDPNSNIDPRYGSYRPPQQDNPAIAANQSNANQGNTNQGYTNQSNTNQGNTNHGYTNSGNTNQGYTNQGNTNQGYTNSGNTNQGYTDPGNTNQGNTNQGYTNQGNTNHGNTHQGNNQFSHNSNPQNYPSGSSVPTTVSHNNNNQNDHFGSSNQTTGNYPDGPYPQNQQHPNVGPHPNHPYNAHPSQQANTSHGQSHPNTNSYNQPIHSNNGYPNGHNAGGDAPNNRREAYQRQLDDSRTQPGYEPPLSASPPNSAGHTRVGMKNSRDPNKYNNTSDDSGISEMDEADRRRAEERLRGQPTSREGDGGTDRRQDLLQLEQRRQEVVDEDRRKKEEEEARWRQWGGAPPGEAGGGGKPGDERGDSGLAGSDRDRRNSNPDENDDALDELLASEDPVDQQELKAKLTEQLEDARAERKDTEKRREDLVKRAKAMQNKTQQRRTQARDLWKKRYFDEKKKTAPLEEQTTRMRQELEALHRKIMSQLEQSKEKDGAGRKGDKPSQQSNLKIQAAKFQHEIEDLQRRVENVKMKLTSEMKLRNQAETELRALRAELTQKKINMSLNRTKVSTQDMSPRESVGQTHR